MLDSFKNHLVGQGKSQSTVQHYNSYLLDFLAWLDRELIEVENAGAKEVLGYLGHLKRKGLENKTRSIRLGVIRQYFDWQISQEKRIDNPVSHLKIRGVKGQKLYPILDAVKLENLCYNYQVPQADDVRSHFNWFEFYRLSKSRNKAILSLMVHQGLVTSEVEKLTLKNLELKQGKIHIPGSRKSNERILELKANQIIELMDYLYTIRVELMNYQAKLTEKLFLPTPSSGRKVAGESLQIWKGFTKELKQQDKGFVNFKQVRTSVITHWLKQYNLRQVQYMAGHRFISSTERYLVNQTEELQADIDRFHPF